MNPGWYDSPNEPGLMRWWDGSQWTAHTQPRPAAPVEPAYAASAAAPAAPAAPAYSPAAPVGMDPSRLRYWRQGWKAGMDLLVGTSEVHQVSFSYDKWWGTARILVNQQQVLKKTEIFSFAITKSFDTTIGTTERHHVRFAKTRQLFFGGFQPQTVQVFIDGQLATQFEV